MSMKSLRLKTFLLIFSIFQVKDINCRGAPEVTGLSDAASLNYFLNDPLVLVLSPSPQ